MPHGANQHQIAKIRNTPEMGIHTLLELFKRLRRGLFGVDKVCKLLEFFIAARFLNLIQNQDFE